MKHYDDVYMTRQHWEQHYRKNYVRRMKRRLKRKLFSICEGILIGCFFCGIIVTAGRMDYYDETNHVVRNGIFYEIQGRQFIEIDNGHYWEISGYNFDNGERVWITFNDKRTCDIYSDDIIVDITKRLF